MKILLTLPPGLHELEIYKVAGMRAPPLGIAWIAAVLERAGHKVRIVDSATLGMDLRAWLHEVKAWRPDVVGLSLLTPTALRGYEAIKALKQELPDVTVIVGGPHPTFLYEEALNEGADIVVRGEGELTTLELVNALERGCDASELRRIRGIAFKDKDGKVVATPPRPFVENLDALPWPAYHLLPMDKYTVFDKPVRVAHIMTSRGCPYGCIFCSTSYFWGRKVRRRSPENVADEIQYLVEKYKVKYIAFADDEFTMSRPFVYALLSELRERGIEIPFACGSRVDHVDRDFLRFLYENGCVVVYFGVESASQETLDRIGKRITVEQARRVFRWRKELGGAAVATFMLGFPWETLDDMKDTVKLAIELDPSYAQFTIVTPYPGTPLFDYAKQHNLIEDWNWEHYTTLRAVMRGFHFTRRQVARMLKYAYLRFYARLGFLCREMKAGRFCAFAKAVFKEIFSLLKDYLSQFL